MNRIRVLTTRAEPSRLDALLRAAGAEVTHFPAVAIRPIRGWIDVDFDWIAFTSATAVHRFFEEARRRRKRVRARYAVVGPGTARALRPRHAALMPREYTTLALGVALARAGAKRVLHPCADIASRDLHHKKLVVIDLPLYMLTRPPMNGRYADPDIVTFASAQTARNFLAARPLPPRVRIVSIGPATSKAVRECGYRVARTAEPHTIEGLVEAVLSCAPR